MLLGTIRLFLFCLSFPLLAVQAPKELPISKGECPKVADALEGVCAKKNKEEDNKYWEFIENNYEIIRQTYSKVVNVFSCTAFRDFVENACSSNCAGEECVWKISLESLDIQKDALPPAPFPSTDSPDIPVNDSEFQRCNSCGFNKNIETKNQTEASSSVGYQDVKNKKPVANTPPPSTTYETGQGKTLSPEAGKDYSPGYMLWGTPAKKKTPIKKY